MPSVVLITGVSRLAGSRLAARLAADTTIDRIIGVDTVPPRGDVLGTLGRTEFVRADIRNPLIAKVIASAKVDTVVHLNVLAEGDSDARDAGGRSSMKEINVIGTMQLLAACQKADSLRHFVLKSRTAVYGASPRDPALVHEDTEPRHPPRGGSEKDAVEIEEYVRGFARRRADVSVTMLRLADLLGPGVDTALTRYFRQGVVPTVLGYDPRLQFLHLTDALAVLERAVLNPRRGVFNIAGEGMLTLGQALRRSGRVSVPVPMRLAGRFGLSGGVGVELSPDTVRLMSYGRVVDTSRARAELDFAPRFSTAEAFDDFVRTNDLAAAVSTETLAGLERQTKTALRLARGFVRGLASDPGRDGGSRGDDGAGRTEDESGADAESGLDERQRSVRVATVTPIETGGLR